jgi:RNA polymerase sigma factor for flagellar operon FliA
MSIPSSSNAAPESAARASQTTAAPLTPRRRGLVALALGLVKRIAAHFARLYPGLVAEDELVSLGYGGAVDAARRFDHDRGVPFGGFAEPRVRGAMLDGIRAEADRRREERTYRRIAAEQRGEQVDGRVSVEPISISEPSAGRDSVATRAATVFETLGLGDTSAFDDRVDDAQRLAALEAAIAMLPDEQRRLALLLRQERSLPEIAAELGWSRRTAERRKREAIAALQLLVVGSGCLT